MKKLLGGILDECRKYTEEGRVAGYIPELSSADRNNIAVSVMNSDGGEVISSGDSEVLFTMQSVVKPVILLLALEDKGEERVRELVGVEATGKPFDAFNYSDRALTRENINPMINTGAIALCTLISGDTYEEKFERLLAFTRVMADNPALEVDERVYLSERATGHKNRALAYMLKAYGMVSDDAEDILEVYFKACSIKVTSRDLAAIAYVLAMGGKNARGEQIISSDFARYINAVLVTSGMYDGSGEFAVKVGIPAKSGVGGGIMAVVPGKMGIGIYAPALDSKGNSIAGVEVLERLSRAMKLSIFGG